MTIAREGWPIIAVFALAGAALTAGAAVLLGPAGWGVAAIALVLLAWSVWFFRDPDRLTPSDPAAVISPADGVVAAIGDAEPPAELGPVGGAPGPRPRIAIFMNVFDVHVNRAPVAGSVRRLAYRPGRFFNASLDKASADNERASLLLRRADGAEFAVVQIAGLVARRIVRRVREGQALAAGERFGMIRFGSRVEVFMPAGASPAVAVGERVTAGATVLARLPLGPVTSPPADAAPEPRHAAV